MMITFRVIRGKNDDETKANLNQSWENAVPLTQKSIWATGTNGFYELRYEEAVQLKDIPLSDGDYLLRIDSVPVVNKR